MAQQHWAAWRGLWQREWVNTCCSSSAGFCRTCRRSLASCPLRKCCDSAVVAGVSSAICRGLLAVTARHMCCTAHHHGLKQALHCTGRFSADNLSIFLLCVGKYTVTSTASHGADSLLVLANVVISGVLQGLCTNQSCSSWCDMVLHSLRLLVMP